MFATMLQSSCQYERVHSRTHGTPARIRGCPVSGLFIPSHVCRVVRMSTPAASLSAGLPILGEVAAAPASSLSCTSLKPGPASRPKATAPLPMTRAEMTARGWDEVDIVFVTGDAYVDHPSFAMALLGRLLESEGLSRGDLQPARLADLRAVADVRPAAAVLRDQRRQHGLDDQPLHGQPQGAQRRRLQSRRADRPAARSGDAGLLPAGARGVSRRAGDRRRRRGQPAPARPLRLLERQGPPLDHPGLQGRPAGLRHGRAGASSRSPAGWRPGRRCATCATCAAWPIGWGPSESPPTRGHDHAAQLRAGLDRQAGRSPR